MAGIERITDFTYSMAKNRFKNIAVDGFEIKGKKFISVDVLSTMRGKGRVKPDRYIFDESGNFVSRNVVSQSNKEKKSIVTVPDVDGFVSKVVSRDSIGELKGSKLIMTNNSNFGELLGDTNKTGISGFVSKVIAKFKGRKVDGLTPVNIKIVDDADKGQKYAIHASAPNGDVMIRGNEKYMQVAAKELDSKVPILTEIFLDPGRIETGAKVANFLETPLTKLKSFE